MSCTSPEAKAREKIKKREWMREWRKDPANAEKSRQSCRSWLANNREKARAATAAWTRKNPESYKRRCQNYGLKNKYGITLDDRDNLLKSQGNACTCCRSPDPKHKSGWRVDHDHQTGAVRGIVCQPCNHMLTIHVDENRLFNAIHYLRNNIGVVNG